MQHEGMKPDKFFYPCILKACGNIGSAVQGRVVHDQIIRLGFEPHGPIQNTLIDMYAKCGSLAEARHSFDRIHKHDIVSWGAMIAGYAAQGFGVEALDLMKKMQWESRVRPNPVVFMSALQACSRIKNLNEGQLLHEQTVINAFQADGVVGSALINMYSKCGSLKEAYYIFQRLPEKDAVSWGAMIEGYAEDGDSIAALALYKQMHCAGIAPSKVTFLSVLKACGKEAAIQEGRLIHKQVVLDEVECNDVLGNALVDMYAKCGSLAEAENVFEGLTHRNEVSWNELLQAYVQSGLDISALESYVKMRKEGIKADKVTFLALLKACGNMGATPWGRMLHDEAIERGCEWELPIQSSLIDMYAKCASMEEAQKIFDTMQCRDVISWGAIITGYAQCGEWQLARKCFLNMEHQGVKPDSWIFSSILAACGHAGQVIEGQWYFNFMIKDHGITPSMEHFNCLIDLLSRAGCLKEARDMVQSMPLQPDANGWTSLLTSCQKYGVLKIL